jgi:hypothetical protein
MPVGVCLPVFGQVNRSGAMGYSSCWKQTGVAIELSSRRPLSQRRLEAPQPLPSMQEVNHIETSGGQQTPY